MRRFAAFVFVLGSLGLSAIPSATAGAASDPPRRYIVVLKDSVSDSGAVARDHGRAHQAGVSYVYGSALKGYAATIPAHRLDDVRSDPRVAYIEPDAPVYATQVTPAGLWGLDRIDETALPLDGSFNYVNTGAGVTAYVIDTGIVTSHSEFETRASVGFDAFSDGRNGQDCNGHGTHVAGTIGGKTFGVAKGVSLVAVRVLNCKGSGTTAGVIAGVDWVTSAHQNDPTPSPAVANMSLGGGLSSTLDAAVKRSIDAGVSYAVAAGNGDRRGVAQDACKSSPAAVLEAMTIGATDITDKKASWSNYGNCVDWFAPGVNILSAWYDRRVNNATRTISGTSMATPHTAGVAALYLEDNPGADPAAVRAALFAKTTRDIVTSANTANDHLLFMGGL